MVCVVGCDGASVTNDEALRLIDRLLTRLVPGEDAVRAKSWVQAQLRGYAAVSL